MPSFPDLNDPPPELASPRPILGAATDADMRLLSAALVAELEALREADRRKDEFIATLSHELRNPLAPLRNALHILAHSGDRDPSTARIHEMMERQVSHLLRLVDDLQQISRISRGKLELRKEPVEVATIVRNASETAEPLVQARKHRLTVCLPEEVLWLNGDPVRLSQMLGNVLNNAVKYTDPGGDIHVRARPEGDDVVISVTDTGRGIAQDEREHIFKMFTRGKTSGGAVGLGIGLALARQLVVMHGGAIEARSEGPGRGSEFLIRLPLSRRGGFSDAEAGRGGDGLQGKRVLIVDDDGDAAGSLAAILAQQGGDVRVACDGPAALETLDQFSAAIVLLDIGMPGMDGYEVARRIRARNAGRRTPVLIALTGWGQEQDRARAHEAGFDHHLVKPAEIQALNSLLATL